MKISEHLNKDNLHHAYLIQGAREEVVPEILAFVESLGMSIVGNPDLYNVSTDSLKIEDARNLKSLGTEMSFTKAGKRIFIISANSFLLEAQNTLLKMFEEPIENTHFFIIVPDTSAFLKTFISRFYLISTRQGLAEEVKEAEKFIAMPLRNRIDFVKELLAEQENEDEEIITMDSTRAKAIKFLNAIETVIHKKLENSAVFTLPGVPGGSYADQNFLVSCCNQILKVREFLRMPGSSTKSLMESVALIIPVLQ